MKSALPSLLAACALLCGSAQATPPAPFSDDPEVRAFVADMQSRHDIDAVQLLRDFATIRPNATVLRAIRPAAVPEQQRSWARYRERFINARRIDAGLLFWQAHAASLRRAEALYGVPPEIVVAIIGVETEYGRNTGRFRVLEALASLAFHYPPRAEFFRRELEDFLLLARENGLSALEIKGSYAGAIGIPQFMPSSQRRYAVDFDGDARIDLRGNAQDAIGSVAHFLQQHGWEAGAPVALPVRLAGDPAALLAAGIRPATPLAELPDVVPAAPVDTVVAARPAALIELATPGVPSEYWAGFGNFYTITRYNRSSFYAMSVFQLAEALRSGLGTRTTGQLSSR